MHIRTYHRDKICYDLCVLDVFISVTKFMRGGPATPWWKFTSERKRQWKRKTAWLSISDGKET
jgi:hypothetical protein